TDMGSPSLLLSLLFSMVLLLSISSSSAYREEDVRLFLTLNRLLPRRPKTSLPDSSNGQEETEHIYDIAPGFLANKRSEFEAPRGFRGMRGKRAPFKGLRGKRGGANPFDLVDEY
ncbi:hypothetical protein PMAYCL1PPCAC_28724, partial [Pristionchus mayeri]